MPGVPLRERWVAEIQEAWGLKEHPSLSEFPEVAVTERSVTSLDAGIDVPITVCTPPGAGGDAFLYLHGGGWIAPASGKHLGWAKRIAALSGQTVVAVHYRLVELERHASMMRAGRDHPSNGIEPLAFQRTLSAPHRTLWADPCVRPAHGDLGCLPPPS